MRKNSKNFRQGNKRNLRENHKDIPLPGKGRFAIDVTSIEQNNMTVIIVYEHQNMRTEFRSMLLKSRVQAPDVKPGQDSRTLGHSVFCWVEYGKLIMIPESRSHLQWISSRYHNRHAHITRWQGDNKAERLQGVIPLGGVRNTNTGT